MNPLPPFANPALAVLGQGTSAVQRQQQLQKFGDQILIDALSISAATAAEAAKGIVDEAEAILTQAKLCRWGNPEDRHSLFVRITHYFEDHPRLYALTDALESVPDVLSELSRRATRRLQMSKTRHEKQAALRDALEALAGLRDFVERLPDETQSLYFRSGLAAPELAILEGIAGNPEQWSDEKLAEMQAEGSVDRCVTRGRTAVAESRVSGVPSNFEAALVHIRIAFA